MGIIIRFIKKWYYRIKEFIYKILNFININVTPGHFTKNDKKNYDDWIASYKQLICAIASQDELPECLRLFEKESGMLAPVGKYLAKSNASLIEKSDNILSEQIKIILNAIDIYIDNVTNNIFLRSINADKFKLDAQKMILLFMVNYIQEVMIFYDDKPKSLDKLELFRKYLLELLSKDSVKKEPKFHALLQDINAQINDCKIIIEERVKLNRLNKLKNCMSGLVLSIKSLIDELLIYIFNLFNYVVYDSKQDSQKYLFIQDIKKYLTDYTKGRVAKHSDVDKINFWLFAVKTLSLDKIDFDIIDPEHYFAWLTEIRALSFTKLDNTDLILANICPAIKELFLGQNPQKNKGPISITAQRRTTSSMLVQYQTSMESVACSESANWMKILNLQNNILSLVFVYNILIFYQSSIEKSYFKKPNINLQYLGFTVEQLGVALNNLNMTMMSLNSLRSHFEVYISDIKTKEHTTTKLKKLQDNFTGILKILELVKAKHITFRQDIIDECGAAMFDLDQSDSNPNIEKILTSLQNRQVKYLTFLRSSTSYHAPAIKDIISGEKRDSSAIRF